jgi:3-phosphoshikimate 1-carboxyvinyltransferase
MSTPLQKNADLPVDERSPHTVFVRGAKRIEGQQHGPVAIELPGSKYYTLRYLLNALLAEGESIVRFPALSDDTAVLVRALRALGAQVAWEPAVQETSGIPTWQARVQGTGGRLIAPPDGTLNVGNAGAVLRLLLGLGALLPEISFVTDHPDSLGRRPNADLLHSLASLGVESESGGPDGQLPITLYGSQRHGGGVVKVSGARSSQYLSALLYLAPLLPLGLDIQVVDGLRSQPLIYATLRALAAAGIQAEASPDLLRFRVPGGQTFRAGVYDVPGDGPTAAALVAAALTLGRPLRLARLPTGEADVQGLLAALHAMGAPIHVTPITSEDAPVGMTLATLELATGGRLRGARIDGDACIDSVPALVAATCFAEGESSFEQVATLRLKESDRIGDLCAELQLAGADAHPGAESITVRGRPAGIAGGVTVQGHDDHRLVQALAIAALRSANGLTITGADAVAKSYPGFFTTLGVLGAEVRVIEA